MADNWEDEADETEVEATVTAKTAVLNVAGDKWEGEDVEDDLPDAWDAASDNEEKKGSDVATTAPKKRRQNIAELQEKKRKEAEERKKKMEEEALQHENSEGHSALSERERQLLQEENELLVVMDTFGSKKTNSDAIPDDKSIDNCDPQDAKDFEHFSKVLCTKIRKYESSTHYPSFLESTFRECVVELELDDLRKLSTMFSAMVTEKQKLQKIGKGKKAKGKGTLKVERDPAAVNEDEFYDEYEDFI